MSNLENAITLATHAHAGQVDKAGEPYIFHPLRVMLQVSEDHERMAAALHDVVEDTDVSLEALREHGFLEEVAEAVDALTKRDGETRLQAAKPRISNCHVFEEVLQHGNRFQACVDVCGASHTHLLQLGI